MNGYTNAFNVIPQPSQLSCYLNFDIDTFRTFFGRPKLHHPDNTDAHERQPMGVPDCKMGSFIVITNAANIFLTRKLAGEISMKGSKNSGFIDV